MVHWFEYFVYSPTNPKHTMLQDYLGNQPTNLTISMMYERLFIIFCFIVYQESLGRSVLLFA
jgi:hypothetical protein